MIRLGARLALAGGREALGRLSLIVIAVAIGAGLLFTTVASINAVNAQNDRYAWLESGFATPADESVIDPLWWQLGEDYYEGQRIGRVDVAATGPESPVPPGLEQVPDAGEYYASPALAELLADAPSEALADRYPGELAGELTSSALPSPDSLLIVIGHSPEELSQSGRAQQIASISSTSPAECGGHCPMSIGIDQEGMTLILAVVAVTVLFPVLIFIGGATRLSAARRERRFAAMRLVGATPRQIAGIATIESCIASAAGAVLGLTVFYLCRPLLAAIPFTGMRFHTEDLSLTAGDILLVLIGIPIAAMVSSWIALRRVTVSPLGITRRATPPAPKAWRLLPLVLGIGALCYFAYISDVGSSENSDAQILAYTVSIIVVMAGVVIAGPWLTMKGAQLVTRLARRPAGLIAGRRLADNPKAGFRAISGLTVAVFVGTVIIGVITTIVSNNTATAVDGGTSATMVNRFSSEDPEALVPSVDADVREDLVAIPGVTGILSLHMVPTDDPGSEYHLVASCEQLAGVPQFGSCADGATTATINPDYGGAVVETGSPMQKQQWPDAGPTVGEVESFPVDTIAVGTDGSTSAIEQARTLLTLEYGDRTAFPPQTFAELQSRSAQMLNDLQRLANVVLLMSLPIAGCSLAVSVAGGLADRKRPFSLLRLSGTPLTLLRRIVAMETVVPLLLSAVVAAGVGFLTAFLFLRAQMGLTLQPPGAAYYLIMGVGLIASLAIIGSTLPLLKRMTGPEVARND